MMISLENTLLKSQIYDKLVTMLLSYHFFETKGLFNFCWCKPFSITKINHFVTKNCFSQFFQCPQHCSIFMNMSFSYLLYSSKICDEHSILLFFTSLTVWDVWFFLWTFHLISHIFPPLSTFDFICCYFDDSPTSIFFHFILLYMCPFMSFIFSIITVFSYIFCVLIFWYCCALSFFVFLIDILSWILPENFLYSLDVILHFLWPFIIAYLNFKWGSYLLLCQFVPMFLYPHLVIVLFFFCFSIAVTRFRFVVWVCFSTFF